MRYFTAETDYVAAAGFETSRIATLRQIAVTVILRNSKSYKREAMIPYLAMTYCDMFISRNELPNVLGRVRDDIVLAANCCLTIAWRRRDKHFSLPKFLENNNLNWEYQKHVLNMEHEILTALE